MYTSGELNLCDNGIEIGNNLKITCRIYNLALDNLIYYQVLSGIKEYFLKTSQRKVKSPEDWKSS